MLGILQSLMPRFGRRTLSESAGPIEQTADPELEQMMERARSLQERGERILKGLTEPKPIRPA